MQRRGDGARAVHGDNAPGVETCLSDSDADCDGKTQGDHGVRLHDGRRHRLLHGPGRHEDVGVCHGGQQTCLGGDQRVGPLHWEVKPSAEVCATMVDENCSGTVNEGCPCSPGQRWKLQHRPDDR